MVKWTFEDDCLAPRDKIEIKYKGTDPLKAWRGLSEKLISIFESSSTNLFERDYRWDASSDPRYFFIRTYIRKKWAETAIYVEVILEGLQPSDPSKEGEISIKIGGVMRSEFELDTVFKRLPIYKGLLWLYFKIFYGDVRRGYLQFCQRGIDRLSEDMRSTLGIPGAK